MTNYFYTLLDSFGSFILFSLRVVKGVFERLFDWDRVFDEMYRLGVQTLPVACLTLLFVGMAFTFQIIQEFIKFGATKLIGGVVILAIVRELSPLLLGVVASGRIAASIAAELGSMSVTDQMDALKLLGKNPVSFLVPPKLVGVALMLPLLVCLCHFLGFLGGFLIVFSSNRINPFSYFQSAQVMLSFHDIFSSLIKVFCFAIVIVLVSSYFGLACKEGAASVGKNTTRAVVVSLVCVFILNYFLSNLLF
ncbi:MAG: ABC transporter permease [bacterium]